MDGPSTPEEVRRAYAQRTKQTHPEEDPEGFQRLHRAYQEARRMAKRANAAGGESAEHAEKQKIEQLRKLQNEPKERTQKAPDPDKTKEGPKESGSWDYDRLFEEEAKTRKQKAPGPDEESKGPKEQQNWDYDKLIEQETKIKKKKSPGPEDAKQGPENTEDWDYDRIFREAELENGEKLRKNLQKRSGLTDENDGWQQAVLALREMDRIRQNRLNLDAWNEFLNGPVFERALSSAIFIFALEEWLKANQPLEVSLQGLLLKRLGLSPGRVPPQYCKVYALLNQTRMVTSKKEASYSGRLQNRSPQQKRMLWVAVVCIGIFAAMVLMWLSTSPSVQKGRRQKLVGQWLSEDLGMTIVPYTAEVSFVNKEELRFKAEEMLDFVFSAKYVGKRDTEKGEPGYETNFSSAALDWTLRQYMEDDSCKLIEKDGWNWSRAAVNRSLAYYLDFPLVDAERVVQKLDAFYKEVQSAPWYQKDKPEYSLSFVRSGVVYFTITSEEDAFDAPTVIDYCKKRAPEGVCGFIMQNTGLDRKDFSAEQYTLFQLEPPLPAEDPGFYMLFAAIDEQTKEVLRLYAFSEKRNELLSYPAEGFEEGQSFDSIKKRCTPYHPSEKVNPNFPRMYRWFSAMAKMNAQKT